MRARSDFDACRQAMLRAFAEWAERATPSAVAMEAEATASAMRQLVDLRSEGLSDERRKALRLARQ